MDNAFGYMLVANKGVVPIEALTTFGVGFSKEGVTIGQFRSGLKYGVACLARLGLPPVIFRGEERLDVVIRRLVVTDEIESGEFEELWVGEHKTGMTLEHGRLDWKEPYMGLREIVSNAKDRAKRGGDVPPIITLVPAGRELMGRVGWTTIAVPLNSQVLSFYESLDKWYLGEERYNLSVLAKRKAGDNLCVYRQGVLVYEGDKPSLYDYQRHDLKLDESRNADVTHVRWQIRCLAADCFTKTHWAKFFKTYSEGGRYYEHDALQDGPAGWIGDEMKDRIASGFREAFGEAAVAVFDGNEQLLAASRGATPVLFKSNYYWVKDILPTVKTTYGTFAHGGYTVADAGVVTEILRRLAPSLSVRGFSGGDKDTGAFLENGVLWVREDAEESVRALSAALGCLDTMNGTGWICTQFAEYLLGD